MLTPTCYPPPPSSVGRRVSVDQPRRLSPHERLLAAILGLALAAPVALATRLTPDARGWGTHEQLGMAPCRIRLWSGRPCPTCGMTTVWAYAVRGDAQAAVAANLGGTLLFAATVVAAAWALASAAAGRWLLGRRLLAGQLFGQTPARWILWISLAWLTATLADWARRLATG